METELIKIWMPVTKDLHGDIVGIISDTSLDRDNELMSKDLLKSWAKKGFIPILADHTNKMPNWIGAWRDLTYVEKGEHGALTGKPIFFSGEANPLSAQIKKQIEESISIGLNAGLSIGAIPKAHTTIELNKRSYKQWTDAELVEASFVPIASNRSAFATIARSFDLEFDKNPEVELTKPKKVEECVEALMSDPEFKPQGGKTKEDSAWAVCQSKFGKDCPLSLQEGISEIKKELTEDVKMTEEVKKVEASEMISKEVHTKELAEKAKELELLKAEVEKLKNDLNDRATVMKGIVETGIEKKVPVELSNEPLTVAKMMNYVRK
jgi:hypothetical protein